MSSPASSPSVPAVLELKCCRPMLLAFAAWMGLLVTAILWSTLPAVAAMIFVVLTVCTGSFALSTQLFGHFPWALARAEWLGDGRWRLMDGRGRCRLAGLSPGSRFVSGGAVLRWNGSGPFGWAFVAESASNRDLLRRLRVRLSIS